MREGKRKNKDEDEERANHCNQEDNVTLLITQMPMQLLYDASMAKKRIKTDAFSVVLREIRTEKGLSQDEVAERLDVARSYISYLESGQRYPSLEMFISVAQALGVRPGEMMDKITARIDSGRASPLLKKQIGPKA